MPVTVVMLVTSYNHNINKIFSRLVMQVLGEILFEASFVSDVQKGICFSGTNWIIKPDSDGVVYFNLMRALENDNISKVILWRIGLWSESPDHYMNHCCTVVTAPLIIAREWLKQENNN